MILKDRGGFVFFVGIIFALAGFAVIFKPDFFTENPPLWSGVAGVLLGALIIVVAKITTVTLDKTSNKILFLWRSLLNNKIQEYTLDQIKEVELSAIYSSGKGGACSYHLALVFNNGEIIPLNPGSSSSIRIMGRQIIPEKTLGTRMANFLNVPFQEKRPPTVSETLSTISSAIQSAAEKEMEKQKNL